MFGSSWIFRVGSRINSVGSTNRPFPRTLLRRLLIDWSDRPMISSWFLHWRFAMILWAWRQWRSTNKVRFISKRIVIRMLMLDGFYIGLALWWRFWLFHQGLLNTVCFQCYFPQFSRNDKTLVSQWKRAVTSRHMEHIIWLDSNLILKNFDERQKWRILTAFESREIAKSHLRTGV